MVINILAHSNIFYFINVLKEVWTETLLSYREKIERKMYVLYKEQYLQSKKWKYF